MAQGTLWLAPIQRAFTNSGTAVAASCKAYFYLAGTTTPVNVYADVGLTTAITQPVAADANGIFQEIFLTPGTAYKVDVQTAAGVSLTGYPADNQLAIPAASSTVSQTGTAGEAITAGQSVYLSDGSGGKNAGQWYKGDTANAYSSVLPGSVGIAPSAISSGLTGSITTGGQVTGLTSLTIGANYYIGSSGALTVTPGLNARLLGRADSTTSLILGAPPEIPLGINTVCGRLTLTTAVPVTTVDVTAATTVFFTPYQGNLIWLFDGNQWLALPFTEISIAVPATTSQMYDVFCFSNAGVPTLELLSWTNDTTRATALTTQNGVLVKTGATTRRYLGSCRTTTVSGQTEDSVSKRYVWNYYNRVPRELRRQEGTATWAYSTATWRQANAAAANQVDMVIGVAEVLLDLRVSSAFANTNANVNAAIAIGEDSTTTPLDTGIGGEGSSAAASANAFAQLLYTLTRYPAVGRHFYAWLEISAATPTTTFIGNGGLTGNTHIGGIIGVIPG